MKSTYDLGDYFVFINSCLYLFLDDGHHHVVIIIIIINIIPFTNALLVSLL